MSAPSLIGSKVTIITKNELRFEGILYTIEQSTQTVVLQNVRSFGSEDRRKDTVIPASVDIVPFVTFQSNDIKDLNIEQGSAPSYPPQPPAGFAGYRQPPPGYPPQPGYGSFGPPGYPPPPGMYGPPPGYPPYGYPPYGYPPMQGPPPPGMQQGPPPAQLQQGSQAQTPAASTTSQAPPSGAVGAPARPAAPAQATAPAASLPPPPAAATARPAATPATSAAATAPAATVSGPARTTGGPSAMPAPQVSQRQQQPREHRGDFHHREPRSAAPAAQGGAAAAGHTHPHPHPHAHPHHVPSGALPGTGAFIRARGHGDVPVGADYDFEKANAMLDKLKVVEDVPSADTPAAAVAAPAPTAAPAAAAAASNIPAAPAYVKTDFFDSLSRGAERSREDRSHQRETDLATFGELTVPQYRRGGGRGRGGRGGYRGGHRGGFGASDGSAPQQQGDASGGDARSGGQWQQPRRREYRPRQQQGSVPAPAQ